jgi:branched-chain amino acid aminotransferase
MLTVDWDISHGWHKPQILPYGPLTLANTATVLHYGISVYEGMSSCLNKKTGIPQAFRADLHLKSFLESSDHLDMPLFDTTELLGCIKKLVHIDQAWYPKADFAT